MNTTTANNMIITPKKFDVNEITLADVQKNKMGGNIVYIKYGSMKKLTLQTPLMSAPFGISTYVDEKTNTKKHTIDVSFNGANDDPKIEMFQNKMQEFDDYLVTQGATNSKSWFGKNQKREVVEALYRPLVKPAKDPEKYAPTMKVKIQTKDDEFQVEAYKYNDRTKFDFKDIAKGAKIQMILELSSIWFVGKTQFGVTWVLKQVRVQQPEKLLGYSFTEDSDDDEDPNELEDSDNDLVSKENEHAYENED